MNSMKQIIPMLALTGTAAYAQQVPHDSLYHWANNALPDSIPVHPSFAYVDSAKIKQANVVNATLTDKNGVPYRIIFHDNADSAAKYRLLIAKDTAHVLPIVAKNESELIRGLQSAASSYNLNFSVPSTSIASRARKPSTLKHISSQAFDALGRHTSTPQNAKHESSIQYFNRQGSRPVYQR